MGALTTEITAESLNQVLEKSDMVVIDWWAPWCGPCRAFAPIFEGMATKHPDITFGKINTDEQSELAGAFQIRSIPTLMVFRERVLLFSQPGVLPANALEDVLKQVQALDMDDVRQKIAEQDAAEQATTGKEALAAGAGALQSDGEA